MRLWPRRSRAGESAESSPAAALELRLEGERFAPGEAVRGSVVAADGVDDVRVIARFRERTVECDVASSEVPASQPRREEVPGGLAHRFTIELPLDALPSCPSPHGGLAWTVDAEAPALGSGATVSRPIEVTVAPPVPASG